MDLLFTDLDGFSQVCQVYNRLGARLLQTSSLGTNMKQNAKALACPRARSMSNRCCLSANANSLNKRWWHLLYGDASASSITVVRQLLLW